MDLFIWFDLRFKLKKKSVLTVLKAEFLPEFDELLLGHLNELETGRNELVFSKSHILVYL
ncbi:MAG: hypothetical protein PSV36_12135 [Algoriphagus sp.]|nr:hypothetical protein [Algoriphagus sp.]